MRQSFRRLQTLLGILLLFAASASAAPAKFEVTEVKGAPTVRPFKSLKKVSVKVGDKLVEKSRLALKDGDLLVLKTPKGDVLTFKDKTFAQLKELSVSGNDKKVNVGLHLGNINCDVTKLSKESEFIIRTPSAVAGVRGTQFDVEVEEDGSSEISVDEGEVEVAPSTGEGEKISVGAGQAVVVKNDGSVKVQRSSTSRKSSGKKSGGKKSSNKKSSEKKTSGSKKSEGKSEGKSESKSSGGSKSSGSSSSDSSGSSGSSGDTSGSETTETESTQPEVETEEVETEEVETEVDVDDILDDIPDTNDIEVAPTYIIEFERVQ